MLKMIEALIEVIRMETEIIDHMFSLLLQHVSTEDEGMKKILDEIKGVVDLKKEIEADPLNDEGLPF